MIENVIVTARFGGDEFDLELPFRVAIKEILPNISELIKSIGRGKIDNIKIKTNERFLEFDETLESAKVWDGSVITIVEEG